MLLRLRTERRVPGCEQTQGEGEIVNFKETLLRACLMRWREQRHATMVCCQRNYWFRMKRTLDAVRVLVISSISAKESLDIRNSFTLRVWIDSSNTVDASTRSRTQLSKACSACLARFFQIIKLGNEMSLAKTTKCSIRAGHRKNLYATLPSNLKLL